MLKEKIMSVKLFSKIMWDRLNKKLWPEKKIVITPKHVENYLKENVSISVNGKEVSFKYLGKEAQLDATWCYLEIEKVGNVKKIEIENTLMLSEFDDQTNLVNLNIAGRKKSGIGRKSVSKLKFEF